MALYRLHKGPWEQELRHATEAYKAKVGLGGKAKGKEREIEKNKEASRMAKRKRGDGEDDEDASQDDGDSESEEEVKPSKSKKVFPGGGKKGISSGLGVVIRRNGQRVETRQRGVPRGGRAEGSGSASMSASSNTGNNWWESV
jgi:RNA exonuclease 4